jgi:hypothetical protein
MSHEMTTPKRNAAFDDPSALSPHERLRELTAILANGIHRLRAGRRLEAGGLRGMTPASPEWGQISAESSQTGLDPGRGLALMASCLQGESAETDDAHSRS